jgi:DNA-binding transcriptional LysR family regulator
MRKCFVSRRVSVRMNTNALRYFHELCEEGSFPAAAQAIPMTTQGLRKIVRGLEDDLGAKLYVGTREGVIITESGRRVDQFYRDFMGACEVLERDLRRLQGSENHDVQVCFSFGSFGVVCEGMLAFAQEHPEYRVGYASLAERSLVREMEAGSFDMAVTWGAPDSDALVYEHVTDIDMYAVARRDNPILQHGPLHLRDLDGQSIVSIGEFHKPHLIFLQRCAEEGVAPVCRHIAAEMPVTQAYLRQGLGIGLALAGERSMYDPQLFAFERIEDFALPVGLSYRHDQGRTALMRELAELLARLLAQARHG